MTLASFPSGIVVRCSLERLAAAEPARAAADGIDPHAWVESRVLAGVAAAVYRDVREGVPRAVGPGRAVPPDPDPARQYTAQAGRYRMLYPALAPVSAL